MKKSVLITLICSMMSAILLLIGGILVKLAIDGFELEPRKLVLSSASAAAVYDGSLFALSDLLNCCGIIRQSSFAAALLEMIGIILGFVLVTIFLFTGNIRSLGIFVLMGYQMFWLLAITVVILLRKKI